MIIKNKIYNFYWL